MTHEPVPPARVMHEDRARASSFGADPEAYDRARPRYPKALLEHLLRDGARDVVDAGCGTGIAAAALAERGATVLGVEPDARMAELARARGIPVEVADWERWDPAGRTFDLVTCAQAWHWIEPVAGAAMAARVLRPGGRLALFWNVGAPEPEAQTAFRAVYARLEPNLDRDSVILGHAGAERLERAARGINLEAGFTKPEVTPWPWERGYTRAEWLDGLPTHSDHRGLPPERLARVLAEIGDAIDALGGAFTMRYETWLVEAERSGSTR